MYVFLVLAVTEVHYSTLDTQRLVSICRVSESMLWVSVKELSHIYTQWHISGRPRIIIVRWFVCLFVCLYFWVLYSPGCHSPVFTAWMPPHAHNIVNIAAEFDLLRFRIKASKSLNLHVGSLALIYLQLKWSRAKNNGKGYWSRKLDCSGCLFTYPSWSYDQLEASLLNLPWSLSRHALY